MIIPILLFIYVHIVTAEKEVYSNSSNYEEVSKCKAFVDKSMFIKEFMRRRSFLHITAPPAMGKSTNLNMLKSFFEININEKGEVVAPNATAAYPVFKKSKIFKDEPFFRNNFKQYPVVFLDFHAFQNATNLETFKEMLRSAVFTSFGEHEYLKNSRHLTEHERRLIEVLSSLSKGSAPLRLNDSDFLHESGKMLTQLLNIHFNKSCIVLIDNYDAILNSVLTNEVSQIEDIFMLFGLFINALVKDNDAVQWGLVTSSLFLTGILSPLQNNLKHVPFSEDPLIANFYGFTQEEVAKLIGKVFYSNNELKTIKAWYEGYNVLNTDKQIFNMYDITRYVKTKQFSEHWLEIVQSKYLISLFTDKEMGSKVEESLFEGSIGYTWLNPIGIPELMSLRAQIHRQDRNSTEKTMSNNLIALAFQYLLETGFYTSVQKNTKMLRPTNYETSVELQESLYKSSNFKNRWGIEKAAENNYVNTINNLTFSQWEYINLTKAIVALFKGKNKPQYEYEMLSPLFLLARFNPDVVFTDVSCRILTEHGRKVDLFILRSDNVAIILDIKRNKVSSENVLQQFIDAQQYKLLNETYFSAYQIKHFFIIALHFHKEKGCSTTCLYDSVNMKDSVYVEYIPFPKEDKSP